MKNRVLSVFGLITNIAIFALVVVSIVLLHSELDWKFVPTTYLYFTVESNILLGLIALIEIPFFIKSVSKRRDQIPSWLTVAKLVTVTLIAITMITTLTWLPGQTEGGLITLISGSQLFLHLVTPCLALVSFLIIETQPKIKFKHTLWVLVPMVLYVGFYFAAIFLFDVGIKDWYHFAYDYEGGVVSEQINLVKSIISIAVFLVAPVALCMILWCVNQLFHKAFFVRKPLPRPEDTKTPEGKKVVIIENAKKEEVSAEEPVKEEAPAPVEEEPVEEPEEEKVEEDPAEEEDEMPNVPEYRGKTETITAEESKPVKKASKPAKKAESAKKPAAEKKSEKKAPAKKAAAPVAASEFGKYEGKTRVYHIAQSKTVDGQWQVKLAGGDRAVKIFKTQKEAIEFAKGLIRTQGGSIRIHSMKGKMRK